ncbi:MAG: DUF3996 domain-containing protein [Spirochaetales bacterium]|nr:DUF3996 domain-containing protein [Spirochaetales bacterium]
MKRILLLAAILVFICLGTASADMGIGAILGEPTGLSFRIGQFPVLGAAWSFRDYIHLHADFWILDFTVYAPVDLYVGVGGKVKIFVSESKTTENQGSSFSVGVRVPVGIQYFPIPEIELFLEITPGISLFPVTSFDADAGIGIRYIFSK